mgnify:CR=1 FL=1
MLVRTYAAELRLTNVRANLFDPGPMATKLRAQAFLIQKGDKPVFDRSFTVPAEVLRVESHRLADLVIGAVLIPGAAAPKLVTRKMLATMKPGAVIVDVAIDQGGCFETSHATTHADPTYLVDGVVHYCVANMPGAVARTSTWALNNATLPFALALADKGWQRACREDAHLKAGLNVHACRLTYAAVGESLGLPSFSADSVLG